MNEESLIFVDLYQGKTPLTLKSVLRPRIRPQLWRWRALNGGNMRVLAVSSEAYTNRGDAVDALTELFGVNANVYLRQQELGNVKLRLASEYQHPAS